MPMTICRAVAQGAVALVVEKSNPDLSVPQLMVADTRLALGQLAKWLKAELAPQTVAMTGSSGKTSQRDDSSYLKTKRCCLRKGILIMISACR